MTTPHRAYTGATRDLDPRFPEVYNEVERQPDPRVVYVTQPSSGMHPMTLACIIAAVLLLVYLSRSGAYANSQHPDPSWAAPAQPAIVINDNSWNMCGICLRGNDAPMWEGQP
jgi:hypothetical protein